MGGSIYIHLKGARIAQWLVCWAHCPAWCSVAGSILLWTSITGDFPLVLTWVLTPLPKNFFKWEYRPRSSLCAHAFHHTDWHSCPRWVNASNKTTQHAPSRKTKCDYLNDWIKKRSHTQKYRPKWWTSDIAWNTEEVGWLVACLLNVPATC